VTWILTLTLIHFVFIVQLDTLGHTPTPSVSAKELPPLLPLRWTPSSVGVCSLCLYSSLRVVSRILVLAGTPASTVLAVVTYLTNFITISGLIQNSFIWRKKWINCHFDIQITALIFTSYTRIYFIFCMFDILSLFSKELFWAHRVEDVYCRLDEDGVVNSDAGAAAAGKLGKNAAQRREVITSVLYWIRAVRSTDTGLLYYNY